MENLFIYLLIVVYLFIYLFIYLSVQLAKLRLSLFCNQTTAITIIIINVNCYNINIKTIFCCNINVIIWFQQKILFMLSSKVDPLQKMEFPRQNRRVGTNEAVKWFPETDFLICMWLANPLEDALKYIKQLQKKWLEASQLPLCSNIRGCRTLLSSQTTTMKLKL